MEFEFAFLSLVAAVIPVIIAIVSKRNLNEVKRKKIAFDELRKQNKKDFEAKKDNLKPR
ncbi:hypothetical protein ACLEYI_13495 [Enterobacter ludwigii]|uniref:hypothetical protein n=1 Tax=Enterobacter ludwigii TaxID=299767 RepID=UPI003976829B